ncbi:bicarbonate ABC-type transporter, permease TauC-like protein [Psychroflexus torquis ATCC 700755]|uniref:Bicarbonate ABC-type transporter, permease TauC-like protein n=1 Tax=Psychroflexus torquis (strain ATCC 700755 / CIP 106069 / ACAM 623) TaxID=313595 RepID=K4IEC9_PSYTT|nr:ABC transporter permease [Psychroflexus torquis]AFU68917.1 bicarbonate ABC-type transporter, permease TauC-like protein [Psychroflexus torquis ATCC 700755]
MKRIFHRRFFIISLLAILTIWFLLTELDIVSDLFLPSFNELYDSLIYLFREKEFSTDIYVSTRRVWFSFLLAFVVAIPLGLLMSESKILNSIFEPYIDYIRYLPVPALIPLTILFFGIDETSKIVLLFIGTFFPFILLVIDNLKNIPKEYFDLAYSLNYSKWDLYKMKLKVVLPEIYDNSRISIGICWTYLVIAELVAAQEGIGHMIKEAQRFSNTADVYIGILTIGLVGYLTDLAFKKLYPIFFKYKVIN